MCSMERSNAVYLHISDFSDFLVAYMMVSLCFPLAEMVAVNCPMSCNSGEPYGLSFASLGCRTGLQSWTKHFETFSLFSTIFFHYK